MDVFDPATASWEERAQIAEQLLRSLTGAVAGFARDQGGTLPHRLALPQAVAENHVRVLDERWTPPSGIAA